MGAGPTKAQVATRRRQIVQKLAQEVSAKSGLPYRYERGGVAVLGTKPSNCVTIAAKLIRASNGETAMWAIAACNGEILDDPPWGENPATADNVLRQLLKKEPK
jgi:hypothetical protein